jgi:hypothetical protein
MGSQGLDKARGKDTETQVKHILKHGVEKTTNRFGGKWKSKEEKTKDSKDIVNTILSDLGNVGQMGLPFYKKALDYMNRDDNE